MTGNQKIRAALYARVSTIGKKQDTELQLSELRSVAAQRGWNIIGEYVDEGVSGAKDRRPGLDKLMDNAHAGKFNLVACWRFDRFARSTRHLLEALETFRVLGVGFFSLREAVDTTTPAGKALFTMIAAVSELERDLIGERVRAGVQRARSKGVKLGRPERIDVDPIIAAKLRDDGMSFNELARRFHCAKGTIIAAVQAGQQSLSAKPA